MGEDRFTYSLSRFNLLTSLLAVLNRNEDDTDSVIARYLLDHFGHFKDVNIYDAAAECYVSRSSIQRFAKSIGFDSFTDMKHSYVALQEHFSADLAYTGKGNYGDNLVELLDDMASDIARAVSDDKIDVLTELIHDSHTVCVAFAVTSDANVQRFQEELFLAGKLVRVVSNLAPGSHLLDNLDENDLVITLSTTGIFALATRSEITRSRAAKALVTLNRSYEVSSDYDEVLYFGSTSITGSGINRGIRNMYTKYGMTFFLDLLCRAYVSRYSKTK